MKLPSPLKKNKPENIPDEISSILERIDDEEKNGNLPAISSKGALTSGSNRKYNPYELMNEYKQPLCAAIKSAYGAVIDDTPANDALIAKKAEAVIRQEFRQAKSDLCSERGVGAMVLLSVMLSIGATTALIQSGVAGIAILAFGGTGSLLRIKRAEAAEANLQKLMELERIAQKTGKDNSGFEGDKGVYIKAARNIKKIISGKVAAPNPF
ncbi:MAG: hypothetical protein PHE27_05710 [Alphaproteobacteria bacterium]|nr:hypothetical protein [Alphaproteobacteria bacterium]